MERLAEALEARGATVIRFPTVRIVPPRDVAPLDEAIRRWRSFDWVVFTSTHGVEAVATRSRGLGIKLNTTGAPRVAAVGPATASAAESVGLTVHTIPDEFLTDRIGRALGDVCGQSILLPRSNLARESLADDLRGRGANVREVDAYEAIPASPDLSLLGGASRIDTVLFTSASAVRNLIALLPASERDRLVATADVACIGPVTAATAMDHGFRVAAVAHEHTIAGLVRTLEGASVHG